MPYDIHNNIVVECTNSHIKNYTQLFNFDIEILEQWRVEVESTKRTVKRLKSRDIFLVFIDLESRNDRSKEDVQGNGMNYSNASKLLLKIENP